MCHGRRRVVRAGVVIIGKRGCSVAVSAYRLLQFDTRLFRLVNMLVLVFPKPGQLLHLMDACCRHMRKVDEHPVCVFGVPTSVGVEDLQQLLVFGFSHAPNGVYELTYLHRAWGLGRCRIS